jgi:transposase
MDVIFPACAGLDVHKKTVVACCITPGRGREPQRETRTFATMTDDLLALSDWLTHQGVTHVAMESTGEFWKPVYNLLEGSFTLLLGNAAHVTNVPGRKTDVGDAAWLADLLRHGLVRASFIPPLAQRDLRDLTRQRTNLVQERAQVVNHLQKVLEWANLKLAAVASDVTGVSARAMLRALVEGQTNPTLLAELAKGPLRRKRADLARALTGRVRAHHQFLLAQHLTHLDFLEEQIACFDEQIRTHLATALGSSPEPGPPPEREGPEPPAPTVGPIAGPQAVALLDTIPGGGRANCAGDRRRNRHRYDLFWEPALLGTLGAGSPGQPRERRQTPVGAHWQRESGLAQCPGPGRPRRRQGQRLLSRAGLSPSGRTTRRQTGLDRGGPSHPPCRLPHPRQPRALSGLLPASTSDPFSQCRRPGASHRTSWLHGHPPTTRTRGRLVAEETHFQVR